MRVLFNYALPISDVTRQVLGQVSKKIIKRAWGKITSDYFWHHLRNLPRWPEGNHESLRLQYSCRLLVCTVLLSARGGFRFILNPCKQI